MKRSNTAYEEGMKVLSRFFIPVSIIFGDKGMKMKEKENLKSVDNHTKMNKEITEAASMRQRLVTFIHFCSKNKKEHFRLIGLLPLSWIFKFSDDLFLM